MRYMYTLEKHELQALQDTTKDLLKVEPTAS